MWPDRVSNPGPLTYESGAPLTVLCGLTVCNLLWTGVFGHFVCVVFGYLCIVDLLFYVHGKHLRSCRDGQLT